MLLTRKSAWTVAKKPLPNDQQSHDIDNSPSDRGSEDRATAESRTEFQHGHTGRNQTPQEKVVGHEIVFRLPKTRNMATLKQKSVSLDACLPPVRDQKESTGSVYHPRRSHRKSRAGCGNCKRRRVKCDEGKPSCIRCFKYGVNCDYQTKQSMEPNAHAGFYDIDLNNRFPIAPLSPETSTFSMSIVDLDCQIEHALNPDVDWRGTSWSDKSVQHKRWTNTNLLQTFVTITTESIPDRMIQKVMRTAMVRLCFSHACLMHTVFGTACLHLNRMAHPSQRNQAKEFDHWSKAIRLYQSALEQPLNAGNSDALLATCMLMNAMLLCPDGFKPRDSWVFSNNPSAMNWLCLQSGLRILIEMTAPYMEGSIWNAAFSRHSEDTKPFPTSRLGREGLHPVDLVDLCGITDASTEQNNPYLEPFRMLSTVLDIPRPDFEQMSDKNPTDTAVVHKYYNKIVSFIGRLLPGFCTLLRQRDAPALLILAHWIGLMCPLSRWQLWIEGRLRPECIAICMYLEGHEDARVRDLVQFPAKGCGYILQYSRSTLT